MHQWESAWCLFIILFIYLYLLKQMKVIHIILTNLRAPTLTQACGEKKKQY